MLAPRRLSSTSWLRGKGVPFLPGGSERRVTSILGESFSSDPQERKWQKAGGETSRKPQLNIQTAACFVCVNIS